MSPPFRTDQLFFLVLLVLPIKKKWTRMVSSGGKTSRRRLVWYRTVAAPSGVGQKNKSGDSYGSDAGNNGSGGGIGKWLREHLGGGSKGSHDIHSALPSKTNGNHANVSNEEKYFARATICTSQNLYCSLPREHGRHGYNSIRKSPHGNSSKSQGQDRPRSSGSNYHEKFVGGDPGGLTRGGPIYGSEGKSLKKRNRDRRRHSLNEPHVHDRQRRRSLCHSDVEDSPSR
ncbi:hypothetical protein HZH68_015686 [Vespula germanica]|uniref:Uncharacterized protein n=1 Tax=Vespula germanica TaxID=30212 RepID=A0A834MSY3_VESGE|nr:hypothetical protein HZH68_015686 [Vespula germanica]